MACPFGFGGGGAEVSDDEGAELEELEEKRNTGDQRTKSTNPGGKAQQDKKKVGRSRARVQRAPAKNAAAHRPYPSPRNAWVAAVPGP